MTLARRSLPSLLAAVCLGVALTASASAAELKLACAGKGPRKEDSAGTVLCAANPGKARKLSGTVRNDVGQPVAGKLTVTYSSWSVASNGIGYVVEPYSTREVAAGADGSFSLSSNTKTKESIRVDLAADPALGIAGGARAQADVSRRLVTTVKKLGGGRVKVTVKGTAARPLKIFVLDASGYRLPGVGAKKANRAGSANFDLGSRRGQFTTFVDVGAKGNLTDLFWAALRPKFRL